MELKKAMQRMDASIDLILRAVYKTSADLAIANKALVSHARPFTAGEVSSNPAMNPKIRQGIPIDTKEQELAFFTLQVGETEEDLRYRLAWLQRYIVDTIPWDRNSFVISAVKRICTPAFRLKYYYPGKRV